MNRKMKDVLISVTGIQSGEDSVQEDRIELETEGKYAYDPEQSYFIYQESELTGLEGTSTCFTINPKKVIMSREGNVNTRMVFEEGKKHSFIYETPYGAATMGVNTNRVRQRMDEHGGELEINYVVDYDHAVVGRNTFKIQVKEVKKDDVRC